MNTGSLLLLSYMMLSFGLLHKDGLYHPYAIVFVTLGYASLIAASLGYLRKISMKAGDPSEQMLAVAFMLFLYLGLLKSPATEVTTDFRSLLMTTNVVLIVVIFASFIILHSTHDTAKQWILGSTLLIGILFQLMILRLSPSPAIDVFSSIDRSVRAFFENSINPYAISKLNADILPYWYTPSNFYLHFVSFSVFGDVRFLYIVANVIFGVSIIALSSRSFGTTKAMLLYALYLFHPRSLYMLELSWTEPFILLFLSLSLIAYRRNYLSLSAFLLGWMISLKQYLVYFFVHWLLLDRKPYRYVYIVAAVVLSVIPFLLADAGTFIENGILYLLKTDFRSDSLSMTSVLYSLFGISGGKYLNLLAGLLASVLTYLGFRKSPHLPAFLFASSISTFSLLLFGAQAYLNYYFFVGGLLIFLIATLNQRNGRPQAV